MRQIDKLVYTLLLIASVPVAANPITTSNITASKLLCPDAGIWGEELITGVCWTCLFPVRLFGTINLFGDSSDIPDQAADQPICMCSGNGGMPKLGITAGAWLPARLIEIVRKPYCSPVL